MLQKRCDDELNDLVPLRWRVWVCCVKRSAADPECVFMASGNTAPGLGAGGRADGSFPTQRRLDATGTTVL